LTYHRLQSVSRRYKGYFDLHFEISRLELSTYVATFPQAVALGAGLIQLPIIKITELN
jgi:hypothetical protein